MNLHLFSQILICLVISNSLSAQTFQEVEFPGRDGLVVTADLYLGKKSAPTLLLFHQSVSSRGEFRTIAPRLQQLGFNCLAVDLRWGRQDFWNKVPNVTATRNGTQAVIAAYEANTDYQLEQVWPIIWQSYGDMEASLDYLKREGFSGPIWALGSSYSAMLIFKLAAEHQEIAGLLAFSPGEYHPTQDNLLSDWAKDLHVPVYLSGGQEEGDMVAKVHESLLNSTACLVHQSKGRHGASVLIQQEEDWGPLEGFLRTHALPDLAVGFSPLSLTRPSARWDSLGESKPIAAYLWFPMQGEGKPLCRLNYIQARAAHEDTLSNLLVFNRIVSSFLDEEKVDPAELKAYLKQKTSIYAANKPANSTKPILVLSGAHPLYFTDLAERLAMAGYMVVSMARKGLEKGKRLPFTVEGVKEYEKDVSYLIQYLSKQGSIDPTEIAFISWSFEGIPTFRLALEYQAKAFISLDSALGYDYGIALLEGLEKLPYRQLPIIHFTNQDMRFGKDLSRLQTWQKEVMSLQIDQTFDFAHGDFTSIQGILIPALMGKAPNAAYDRFVKNLLAYLNAPAQ